MDGDVTDDSDYRTSGRALVREVLVAGLTGWQRPRKVNAAGFVAMVDRLCDRLAYLDHAALSGLLDLIQRHAGAVPPAVPRWPDAGVIEAWASVMWPRPVTDRDGYVRSLLRSRMGRDARDGGWLVELMRHARRAGPPPLSYSLHRLRDAAADARRRRDRMTERPEQVTGEERGWWAVYEADLARALALVAEGEGRGAA